MVSMTLEGPLAALREGEIDLLTSIAGTLAEMGDATEDDRKRLMDVAQDLRDMFFLVVIIGEFNAGKSTFVNALLGEELLPVGITPTTEMIELVRYSDDPQRKPTVKGDSLREWAHPNTGAKGVAIVDTPGTGSIFQQHEKVAKEFLHRSDLVIFVLSAKRAFADTERIYMETAKNYGKKLILVVNQSDLLEPSEQSKVRRFIEQQVKEHLNLQPLLFMTSAKQALAGEDKSGEGGVSAVKAHLQGVFAELPPAKHKLLSQLDMAESMVKTYHKSVQSKADLISADTAKVKDVKNELEQQSLGLDSQLGSARSEVDKVLTGIRQRGLNFIDSNLSIRKVIGSSNKEQLQAEFQDVVLGRSLRDLEDAAGGYVNAVVDHSRLYWRGVIDRLSQLQELLDQEDTGLDANIYAEQREGLQEAIRIAEAELKTYQSGMIVTEMREMFEANASAFRAWSLTSIGGLIVMLVASVGTAGPLLGTGAAALAFPAFAIATPIAAVGGYFSVRYFRRIVRDTKQNFNERVDNLTKAYHTALDDLTRKERGRLSQYGNQVLTPIFSRLEVLSKRYKEQQVSLEGHTARIETLRKGISEI